MSMDRKRKHRSRTRRSSRGVIHVQIRSTSRTQNLHSISKIIKTKQDQRTRTNSIPFTVSNVTNPNSSILSQRKIEALVSAISDGKCVIYDHHRYRKQNKHKKCFKIICISSVMSMAVIAAITMGLLIKPTKISTTNISLELRWNSTGVTILRTTGGNISVANQLYIPYDIAFDSLGDFYVADFGHNRIQKLSMKTSNVMTVAGQSNKTAGTGPDYLHGPTHMAFDSNNNMYIADRGNTRVQFYTQDNLTGTTVAGVLNTAGSAINLVSSGSGIAYDSDTDCLYVEDVGYNRVMKYSYGTSVNITVAAGNNGCSLSTTTLCAPCGLYLDKYSRSLLISSIILGNVVQWVLGSSNWTRVVAGSPSGVVGNSSTLMNMAVGITLDPMGNLYVADGNNSRIQLFLSGQTVGRTIAGVTYVSGNNSSLLSFPLWVTLDNQLNLYVSDTSNNRIQMFKRY